jgi:hypothetical protein
VPNGASGFSDPNFLPSELGNKSSVARVEGAKRGVSRLRHRIPRVKLQWTIFWQNFAPAQPATRNRTGRRCIVRLTQFSGFSYSYTMREMQVLSWGESETNIAA